MSTIELMIDEENELTFQVQVEGTRPGTAKCRLMLESKNMMLAFEGQSTGDEVAVTLPLICAAEAVIAPSLLT